MGYDMTIHGISAADQRAAEELRKEWYALIKVRDAFPADEKGKLNWDTWKWEGGSEAFRACIEQLDALDKTIDQLRGYFRLNIWGMGVALDHMQSLGMLYSLEDRRYPEFPKPEAFGLVEHPDDEDGWVAGTPERAYLDAHEAVLAWHPADPAGIGSWKFGSNDGWIVTPEEIRAALARAADAPAREDLPKWWGDWVAYLQRAATLGGVEVH